MNAVETMAGSLEAKTEYRNVETKANDNEDDLSSKKYPGKHKLESSILSMTFVNHDQCQPRAMPARWQLNWPRPTRWDLREASSTCLASPLVSMKIRTKGLSSGNGGSKFTLQLLHHPLAWPSNLRQMRINGYLPQHIYSHPLTPITSTSLASSTSQASTLPAAP